MNKVEDKMKVNNSIKINCTTEEKDMVIKKSKEAGMTISNFILYLVKNSEIEVKIKSN